MSSTAEEIPWYRRLGGSKWEFRDETLVKSNSTIFTNDAMRDPRTITEMRGDDALPEILREMGYQFKFVNKTDDKGQRGKKRVVKIEKALAWPQVKAIAERSKHLREYQQGARQRGDRSSRRRSDFQPAWAPTERDLIEGMQPRHGYDSYPAFNRDGRRHDSSSYLSDRPKVERRRSSVHARDDSLSSDRRSSRKMAMAETPGITGMVIAISVATVAAAQEIASMILKMKKKMDTSLTRHLAHARGDLAAGMMSMSRMRETDPAGESAAGGEAALWMPQQNTRPSCFLWLESLLCWSTAFLLCNTM